jgi:hypothetical protein
MEKKLKYELSEQVVNYILQSLNRVQIAGVQQAQDLMEVVKMLQSPLNAEELEKETYETLKGKFEQKGKTGGDITNPTKELKVKK